MTERTYNIIMACKKAEDGDLIDAVKQYMAKECNVPITAYSQVNMSRIMESALYDYIDTCDKPNQFLRDFFEWLGYYGLNVSLGEQIAIAFKTVRVKDRNGNYVNGFGEWAEKIKGE